MNLDNRTSPNSTDVVARLSTLDRFLPLWIGLAMAAGLGLGAIFPHLDEQLDRVKVDTVSLPIAIGLLLMMYPVLAKVRYGHVRSQASNRRVYGLTLFFNWIIGPLMMFGLAWLFLEHQPGLRTGLIVVGIAPCIAMVLIWNDLAFGNREAAAVLVAINAILQIVLFSVYGWFYLTVLPRWFGLDTASIDVSVWDIARSVLIFLGIPLVLGYASRRIGERAKGVEWYERRYLPRVGPIALYGLLFTIVFLFAMQGDRITHQPLDVARVAIPLAIYFAVMWGASFVTAYRLRIPYDQAVTVAFTSAGNNFELAIAVCIAVFGITSEQALAGTIGPLIEVPALIALVYVALWARRHFRR